MLEDYTPAIQSPVSQKFNSYNYSNYPSNYINFPSLY